MTSKEQFEKNVISTLAENGCSENQAMAILKETMEHLGEYLESALEESYNKGVKDAKGSIDNTQIEINKLLLKYKNRFDEYEKWYSENKSQPNLAVNINCSRLLNEIRADLATIKETLEIKLKEQQ